MRIEKYIEDKKKLIDKALNLYLPSSNAKPKIIHRAMRYAVFSGGKRIRPVLTIASFEACGGKRDAIMPAACAIEAIHAYTLIHDDLPCMDNDDLRRGKLSCHKKFTESLALLAGDALLTFSFELLSKTGNLYLIENIAKTIGSYGTIGGQVVDVILQKTDTPNHSLRSGTGQGRHPEPLTSFGYGAGRTELDYIAIHKTGALFEAAVKAGGIFKGVSEKKMNALSDFGRYFGWAFQLVDDLADRDGYVKYCGREYTRKKAEFLVAKAKKSLGVFGKNANNLLEISDFVLTKRIR